MSNIYVINDLWPSCTGEEVELGCIADSPACFDAHRLTPARNVPSSWKR